MIRKNTGNTWKWLFKWQNTFVHKSFTYCSLAYVFHNERLHVRTNIQIKYLEGSKAQVGISPSLTERDDDFPIIALGSQQHSVDVNGSSSPMCFLLLWLEAAASQLSCYLLQQNAMVSNDHCSALDVILDMCAHNWGWAPLMRQLFGHTPGGIHTFTVTSILFVEGVGKVFIKVPLNLDERSQNLCCRLHRIGLGCSSIA